MKQSLYSSSKIKLKLNTKKKFSGRFCDKSISIIEANKDFWIGKKLTPILLEEIKFLLIKNKKKTLISRKEDYIYYIEDENDEAILIKVDYWNTIKDIFY